MFFMATFFKTEDLGASLSGGVTNTLWTLRENKNYKQVQKFCTKYPVYKKEKAIRSDSGATATWHHSTLDYTTWCQWRT
jgi:hypothetical protein